MSQSLPVHLILQEELLRAPEIQVDLEQLSMVSADADWRQQLAELERQLEGRVRPLVIASIEMCERILRLHPFLARGVVADFEFCRFSTSMSAVPRRYRLNEKFLMAPFGDLPHLKEDLRSAFGDRIFIRPDDGRKSFTGFTLSLEHLDFEHSSLRQIQKVRDEELCVVSATQEFRRSEFRCWIIDGQVASAAPYSHYGSTRANMPAAVVDLAEEIGLNVQTKECAFVADFAVLPDGSPRLVEFNALSTSGIYLGADIARIVASMDPILFEPIH